MMARCNDPQTKSLGPDYIRCFGPELSKNKKLNRPENRAFGPTLCKNGPENKLLGPTLFKN